LQAKIVIFCDVILADDTCFVLVFFYGFRNAEGSAHNKFDYTGIEQVNSIHL
jgi:hypothetical protein